MDFFYLRHHYLSIVRSKSFSGEVFAIFILAILFVSSASYSYTLLDGYAQSLSSFFGRGVSDYSLFALLYLFVDLSIRLVFRRPLPKLKYYALWTDKSKSIAIQYLFTSLFGIVPFALVITMTMFALKANQSMGGEMAASVVLWWMANHFMGLNAQFSRPWVKNVMFGVILVVLILEFFLPQLGVSYVFVTPALGLTTLIVASICSYFLVRSTIAKREVMDGSVGRTILDSLPVLSFKNPVLQLEWALLVRNKRTRSNLLLGLISVLLLPFIIREDSTWVISIMIFFVTTGFFIIQHGVYSLGWEGSYFDFLITNISPKKFIRTRYLFYVGTCILGFLLALIPTIIKGLDLTDLLMIFIYNAGVTVPFVLYRSTFNDTKIVLTENSFMNYNGMMTGPIFVSSFLVMLLPLFIYGIGMAFLGENAIFLLGGLGLVGLLTFQPITDMISRQYYQKKYHLSQSFKA